jgi:iron complex outermembrane receptor protein
MRRTPSLRSKARDGTRAGFRKTYRVCLTALALAWAQSMLWAAPQPQAVPPQEPPRDVTDIDLDDLMKVTVTSPSKKEQTLTDVPTAVYVIRSDDLKRSGVTNIADALRSVPGMNVARSNSNTWTVSARGFDDSANKMLVLIDGRSVYSPLHSGVFWDVQDTLLEDIERIEVIRGPGGTLWGANAINGVVNIITKPAGETPGGLAFAGGGTEERVFGGARYGFKVGEDVAVRVYAKYFDREDQASGLNPDETARDGWFMGRGGFRADWKAGAQDRVTFMGDYYDGQEQSQPTVPSLTAPFSRTFYDRTTLRGGDFVFRWDHQLGTASSLTLQAYYDYTYRSQAIFGETIHTGDLDLQYRFSPIEDHDVVCGLGYRVYAADTRQTFVIQTNPASRTDDDPTAFVQDEITLVKNRLRLVLGSKFELNEFTGFEYQPSGRLAWNIDDRQMAWASVTRAVRTPTILDRDIRLNALVTTGAPPAVLSVFGDKNFHSEDLLAYEAGYRVRPVDPLSVDLALFYNRYTHLRSIEGDAPFLEAAPPPAHFVVPLDIENGVRAQSGGAELAANLQAASWWLLQANYSYLRLDAELAPGSTDTTSKTSTEHSSPRHQVWVRSAMDLPMDLTLDVMGRYVSQLSNYPVKAYVEADVRLAWRDPSHRIEAALVGQNLVHDSHAEINQAAQRSDIKRGVYASLTVRF